MKVLRSTSCSFLLLCAVGLLAFTSYNWIRSPLLPLFALDLGANPAQIGWVVAVSTLTGVVIKLPSGIFSDLWGRRRLLWVGLAAFALTPFAYLAVHALGGLVAVRAVHGLATAVFAPVSMALVADLNPTRRGETLGWYSAATQAGKLLGPMLGGFALGWSGFSTSFVLCGALGGVILLLFWSTDLGPAASPRVTPPADVAPRFLRGLLVVIRRPRLVLTAGMEAVLMLASGALMAFLPIYGLHVGLSTGQIGVLFGAQGLVFVAAKPLMGRISDRAGRVPMIVAGLCASGAALAAIPFIDRFAGLCVLAVWFGFGEAVATSSTSALAADLAGPSALGSAMGVFGTIMDIGHAAGPVTAGLLIAWRGFEWAFPLIGGLVIAAGLLFAITMGGGTRKAPVLLERESAAGEVR